MKLTLRDVWAFAVLWLVLLSIHTAGGVDVKANGMQVGVANSIDFTNATGKAGPRPMTNVLFAVITLLTNLHENHSNFVVRNGTNAYTVAQQVTNLVETTEIWRGPSVKDGPRFELPWLRTSRVIGSTGTNFIIVPFAEIPPAVRTAGKSEPKKTLGRRRGPVTATNAPPIP